MNANPYPIYVINLKRTPERKLYIQRQLDALNLSYSFVDAIDRYDIQSPTYCVEIARLLGIDEAIIESKLYSESHGNMACALSHIKAYNLMRENNDQVACILEDDAIISPDFLEILRAAQKVPWDILMLSNQSRTTRYIQVDSSNVQKNVETFRRIDRSLFPRLRKIKWFRRLLPLSVTPQAQLDWTSIPKLQWCFLILLSYSKTLNNLLYKYFLYPYRHFLNSNRLELKLFKPKRRIIYTGEEKNKRFFHEDICSYLACQVGALPIRSSQQTLYGNYDVATPAERPSSGMCYLLTLSTAYRWTKLVDRTNNRPIDFIPWYLHEKYGIRLRIVTPPCITASLTYLKTSARFP